MPGRPQVVAREKLAQSSGDRREEEVDEKQNDRRRGPQPRLDDAVAAAQLLPPKCRPCRYDGFPFSAVATAAFPHNSAQYNECREYDRCENRNENALVVVKEVDEARHLGLGEHVERKGPRHLEQLVHRRGKCDAIC